MTTDLERLKTEIDFLRERLAQIEGLMGNIVGLTEKIVQVLRNDSNFKIDKEVKDEIRS